MTKELPDALEVVLAEEDGLGRIVVNMESFFEFSFWVSEELEDLVQTWQHKWGARNGDSSRGGLP